MSMQIWTRAWNVLKKTWEGWQQHDGFLLSAAMAYYAAFSLFPLCLVLISILGFVLEGYGGAGTARRDYRAGQGSHGTLAGRSAPGPAAGRAGQRRPGRTIRARG